MLCGIAYNSRDPELLSIHERARKLLQAYNNLESLQEKNTKALLGKLLGHIGNNVWISPPFFCDYGENISIGDNTFINSNCVLLDDNKIQVGENVLIAPFVQIYTASHPVKASDRIKLNDKNEAPYVTFTKPVTIGNNVWIGGGAIIMPGVVIGDNVTIGAGSIVTKNIPSDVMAFGNPCKVIKKL